MDANPGFVAVGCLGFQSNKQPPADETPIESAWQGSSLSRDIVAPFCVHPRVHS